MRQTKASFFLMSDSEKEVDCGVCFDKFQTPITLPCSHKFCYLCVKGTMMVENNKCPKCRCIIPRDFFDKAVSDIASADVDTSKPRWMYSGNNGGWWFYQNNHNDEIEQAWQKFITSRTCPTIEDEVELSPHIITINVASSQYEIDFIAMDQQSQTGMTRRIKRVENAEFTKSRGIAGVKYVQSTEVPKYDVVYPDANDPPQFNPHFVDSYVDDSYSSSDSDSYEEETIEMIRGDLERLNTRVCSICEREITENTRERCEYCSREFCDNCWLSSVDRKRCPMGFGCNEKCDVCGQQADHTDEHCEMKTCNMCGQLFLVCEKCPQSFEQCRDGECFACHESSDEHSDD